MSLMFHGCRSPGCVTGWLTGTSIPHTPSWQLPWRATFPSLNVQSAPSLANRKVDSRVGSLNIVLKPDLHSRRVVAPGSGPLQRTAVLGVCLCLVRDTPERPVPAPLSHPTRRSPRLTRNGFCLRSGFSAPDEAGTGMSQLAREVLEGSPR